MTLIFEATLTTRIEVAASPVVQYNKQQSLRLRNWAADASAVYLPLLNSLFDAGKPLKSPYNRALGWGGQVMEETKKLVELNITKLVK